MKSPRYISFCFAALLVLLAASDLCAQWKNVAQSLLNSGIYGGAMHYKDGIVWAGCGNLWSSPDSGKTWTKSNYTGGTVLDINFYDKLTGLVASQSNVYITHDGGASWNTMGSLGNCRSAAFIGSPNVIYTCQNNPPSFHASFDGGVTWKTTPFTASEGMSFVVTKDNTIHVFLYNSGTSGVITSSTDKGITWQQKKGIVDGDSYSLTADSCDAKFLYLSNEEVAQVGNLSPELFVSSDAGDSWKATYSSTPNSLTGSMTASTNAIYAGGMKSEIMRSTDQGISWKVSSGPIQNFDTHLITCINNNIVFVASSDGSIWKTTNSGGDSLSSFPIDGVLNISQKILFSGDTISCTGITRYLKIRKTGCAPPNISDTKLIGIDSASYSILPIVDDSIGINFHPKNNGLQNANLVLTLSDGSSDTISLQGYGMIGHPLILSTIDQSTDTIGGSINVPITINGLDHAEDIDLVLHYDKELRYHGSFSPFNVQLDLPSEDWNGRSKLHITQAKPNTILGYARFDVFNDSLTKSNVTFDSITVLTAVAPCQYILPASVTSIITPPSGCGVQTVSRFLHNGSMPQLSIAPNPTAGEVFISSTHDLGECNIMIYDMLGTQRGKNNVKISKDSPAKILLPISNGVYNVRVTNAERTYDMRVIVNR